jgi:hypothetical protein
MTKPLPTVTLDPKNYHYALNQQCTISDLIWQYVQGVEDWWGVDWHTFYQDIPKDTDLFKQDPVIAWFLAQGWVLNFTCMPPKSHYRWHIDTSGNRQTAINLVLNQFDSSMAIWRAPGPWVRKTNSEILELRYQPRTYYLFNTQEEHCVYNFGLENRYMLTLGPGERFAVPEYRDGLYNGSDFLYSTRRSEILQGYKRAYGQVLGEIQAQGW